MVHPLSRFSVLASAVIIIAGAGCAGDHPTAPRRDRKSPVFSVQVGADTLVIIPGAFTLHAALANPTATTGPWGYVVTWGDSTSSSGTVSDESLPLVLAHSYTRAGQDTVIVSVHDAAGAAASAAMHVAVLVDRVTKIHLVPANIALDVGATTPLAATALGMAGATLAPPSFTWTSGSPAIATVSTSGLVTGVSAGTANIFVTSGGIIDSASVVVSGLPFGPFHMPDNQFRRPFTAVMRGATPATLLADLAVARKAHLRVLVELVEGPEDVTNPDSTFSLALWERSVDRYRAIDISPYIADGTIIGHFLFDEPRNPANWGGVVVPYAEVDSAAAYSKSIWPAMRTGAGSSAVDMESGAPYTALDFAFTQYRDRKGDLTTWVASQTAAAARSHVGVLLSINVLQGTIDDRPYPAARLKLIGTTLAAEPSACGLTMWKYDSLYFADSTNKAALWSIAKVAGKRPPRVCAPD